MFIEPTITRVPSGFSEYIINLFSKSRAQSAQQLKSESRVKLENREQKLNRGQSPRVSGEGSETEPYTAKPSLAIKNGHQSTIL